MGYDLYTDRFYTSPEVATELLQISTSITGTVQTNRRNMPAAVVGAKQKRGDVATYRKGPLVVASGSISVIITLVVWFFPGMMVSSVSLP